MSNIFLQDLKVYPFTPCSPIIESYPGFEHFSYRADFIAFTDMRGVALAMTAINADHGQGSARTRRRAFVAWIEAEDGSVVVKQKFEARMSPWVLEQPLRIDLSARLCQFELGKSYTVKVASADDETNVVQTAALRLLRPSHLPDNEIKTVYAWLENDEGQYCNVTERMLDFESLDVCFLVRRRDDSDPQPIPELELRVTDSRSRVQTVIGSYVEGEFTPTDIEEADPWAESCGKLRKVSFPLEMTSGMGVCYAELRVLGRPIAGMIFDTDADEAEEGAMDWTELDLIPQYEPADGRHILSLRRSAQSTPEQQEIIKQYDSLVGLADIKAKVTALEKQAKFSAMRVKAGMPGLKRPLHSIFLGSPGTGKTTVAKMMGALLHRAGLLSKGHVVVTERSHIVGKFYGSEAEKINELLEQARGGILFIDEAYQLYNKDDAKDPVNRILDSLLTAIADEDNRDWMLILAGYTEPMRELFKLNPGLRSRFPETNEYYFADYDSASLVEIARRYLAANSYSLTPEAEAALQRRLERDYAERDATFGNGRHVMNLIQTAILPAMAERVTALPAPTLDDLKTIAAADIPEKIEAPKSQNIKRQPLGFKFLQPCA